MPDEVIQVPDTDPATFEYYLRCVKENETALDDMSDVTLVPRSKTPSKSTDERHTDAVIMQHCKGYFLATKLGDLAAANQMIDALIEHLFETDTLLRDKHVNWIIETLSGQSGLYKLAVDLWAFGAKFELSTLR